MAAWMTGVYLLCYWLLPTAVDGLGLFPGLGADLITSLPAFGLSVAAVVATVLALRPRPAGRGRRLDALPRDRVHAQRSGPDVEFHDAHEVDDPVRFECPADPDAIWRLVRGTPNDG